MTALEVYERVAAADSEIRNLEERIERRRELAVHTSARPLSADGGSHGSGDASVRVLDYMVAVEDLTAELEARKTRKLNDAACCLYICDMLPPTYAAVMMRRYVEGKTLQICAAELNYSYTSVRRFLRQAERLCAKIILIQWDGVHVPVLSLPSEEPTER